MSLDIYLKDPTSTYEVDSLFEANITHNLGKMAEEAGIYTALWRPEEIMLDCRAKDIMQTIEDGLLKLKSNPNYFQQFNPENGWGTYGRFVEVTEEYLNALKKYPEAKIIVNR